MASNNKTLQLLASKLGLSEEEKVLSKAAEFDRLLQTKSTAGSNLSDTSKLMVCLDLAAGILGVDLDVKTAIKYSGLKPIAYTSNRKTIENLLELNCSQLTVPQMCVSLQCTGIQEVAEKILEEYRRHAKMELDLSLPQYVCMAVYQAGRINKVKVSKVKINEKCRLKPAQWALLEADWTKFVNDKFSVAAKKRGRPAKVVVADENQEMEIDSKEEAPTETEIEPYEEWRRRMLEAAYRELEQREKENKKSPKKTPLKERGQKKDSRSPQKEIRFSLPKEIRVVLQKELRGTSQREHSTSLKGSGTPQKDLRGTPQKMNGNPQKDLRGTPLKMNGTPQKDLRGTPQKMNGTPQKDLRGTPQKDLRGTPQKMNGTPQKDLRSSAQKDLLSVPEDMSPRKSPRKTPTKYSPYKTPTKGGGVRLLFPNF